LSSLICSNKAAVDIETDRIEKIDFEKKVIIAGRKEIPFTHLVFAGGSSKETLKSFVNVFNINDYESHAQVHNKVIKAKHV
jgi:NADH dehydrogenase FAD-containing subunit